MGRLFGTDGVRGVANRGLTPELALSLGRSAAKILKQGKSGEIYIGRDTRISGDMLEAALVAGITSAGANAVLLGVVPTPGVAHLVRAEGALAGVVISASHNPMEDNGIKFFSGDGFKLSDELEDEIAARLEDRSNLPIGREIGRVRRDEEAWLRYGRHLAGLGVPLHGLRVVVDCANGAAWQVAPWVLRELGADCLAINAAPNGININVGCGSTHPEQLQQAVLAHGAQVGLAHDGDADRLIAVDEKGQVVNGDQILAICALHDLEKGLLPKNTVAATVYSNLGLHLALKARSGKVLVTKAGDRYVLEAMLRENLKLGGEQSGHVIFLDYSTTGDGIITALQLLRIMIRSGRPLSELAAQMPMVPQVLLNVPVRSKAWEGNPAIQEVIGRVAGRLGGDGRIFVRSSGTESLIRVLAEGLEEDLVKEAAAEVAAVIKRELG